MAKEKATPEGTVFGIFTQRHGSYTLGEHTISAGAVAAVPKDTAGLACPETSPVKFYGSEDDANAALDKLKAQWKTQN